jgi:hypothetical protein
MKGLLKFRSQKHFLASILKMLLRYGSCLHESTACVPMNLIPTFLFHYLALLKGK